MDTPINIALDRIKNRGGVDSKFEKDTTLLLAVAKYEYLLDIYKDLFIKISDVLDINQKLDYIYEKIISYIEEGDINVI